MTSVILTTLNARWSHCAFGLRCLRANLGELHAQSRIIEFTINDPPAVIAERLLADAPRIVGFGVYIWNLRETTQVVRILKAVAPELRIVIGGPEVSYDSDHEAIVALSDVRITGEADLAFAQVCRELLADRPVQRTVVGGKVDPQAMLLPYGEYSDEDLSKRIVYVEASRGCPFTCEFCLSSIENGVRTFPQEAFLAALDDLIRRGCRTFKFIDRTFNLSMGTATGILRFFQEHWHAGMFLHFELVPDRLPEELKQLLLTFPPGAIQFEIGIQSFTPVVGELISRRMHRGRTEANLAWLRDETGIHVHADLIIGLPGETLATFQDSFDSLWRLRPGEIQVGILKLLKGTPLIRHREAFAMQFNGEPPYDLLASRDFPFACMQRLKRFARYFDLFVNHGHFPRCLDALIAHSPTDSPFLALLAFSDWVWAESGQTHAFARSRLYELLMTWLGRLGLDAATLDELAAADAADGEDRSGAPHRLSAIIERHRRARTPAVRTLTHPG